MSNSTNPPASQAPNGSSAQGEAGPSRPVAETNGNGAVNGTAAPTAPAATNGDAASPLHDLHDIYAARRAEEIARRDRSLAEFLTMLDGYKPLIPEEVTEYYLQRAGFDCSDPRLKRLLSLSAQKFVSELATDAYHFAKLRVGGTAVGRGRPASGVDRNKVVLTQDDLQLALNERGINATKPDYYL